MREKPFRFEQRREGSGVFPSYTTIRDQKSMANEIYSSKLGFTNQSIFIKKNSLQKEL